MSTDFVPFTRRQFLKGSVAGAAIAALPNIIPSRLLGANAPSNRLGVAVIGTGGMGKGHVEVLLGFPDVRIVGVCDVDRWHRAAAAERVNQVYGNRDCVQFSDFREVAARPDIDAIWVATPENWHALVAIEAIRHGKDVYVEKPLTLTIREGRELVSAARQHGRIVQTGSQQRSSKRFHDLAEFVRGGGLGKIDRIDIIIPANNRFAGATWQPDPVPEGLDYDMWLGPAPWRPFCRHACHYNFRFVLDLACGQVTNWGAHYIDIAQWALDADAAGPVEVEGHGEFPSSGLFSTATNVDFTCRYPGGERLRCHTRYDGVSDGNIQVFGERGWISMSRETSSASDPALLREASARLGAVKLPVSRNHHDNFLQCVRTRERPIADVEIGHRSATVCNIGNLAMVLDRKLRWDPAREEFIDDAQANRLRQRSMRGPWSLA